MSIKLLSSSLDLQWVEISKNARNSMIILDNPSAECLHWHGGLKRLMDHGAISIENLSPFVSAGSNVSSVLFIFSTPFSNETRRTVTVILRANDFKHCTIITSLPLKHFCDESDSDLEYQLGKWMNKRDATASIRHIPFHTAYITNNVFILPSFAPQFSVYKSGFAEMNRNRNEEVTIKSIPGEMQYSIRHLAACLSSLLECIGVRAETFSLGPLSHLLGTEMETLAQQHKKQPSSRASLVCVDRLLDLAGPCSQSQGSTLARLMHDYPRLPGHTFDVALPMNALCNSGCGSVFDRPLLAPGCLAHKETTTEENMLQAILYKSHRDVLMEVNRGLAERASRESIAMDPKLFAAKLTPEQVKANILAFKAASAGAVSGLLEQAWGAALSGGTAPSSLGAMEGALLEYLAQSPERVLENIMEMMADKEDLNFSKLDTNLILLAFFYLLSGEASISNESAMQATLMEEFFHDKNREELLSLFVDEEADPSDESVLDVVRTFFDVLKRLGSVRRTLQRYKSLFNPGEPAFPASYSPLLKQLLDDITDPSLSQVPDLAYHSAGLKDYLKTGFSLFVKVARANPRSNPLVFVLVLGGVTPAELQLFKEARRGDATEVVLLCCGLVTPRDVLKDLAHIVKDLQRDLNDDEDSS